MIGDNSGKLSGMRLVVQLFLTLTVLFSSISCRNWAAINKRFPLIKEVGETLLKMKGESYPLDQRTKDVLFACLRGAVRREFLDKDLLPEVYTAWGMNHGFIDRGTLCFFRYPRDPRGYFAKISFDRDGNLLESGGGKMSSFNTAINGEIYHPSKNQTISGLKGTFDGISYQPPSHNFRFIIGGKGDPATFTEASVNGNGEELSFRDKDGREFSLLVSPSKGELPVDFVDEMVRHARSAGAKASKVKLPWGGDCFVAVELFPVADKKKGRAKLNAVFPFGKTIIDVFVISIPGNSTGEAINDGSDQLQAFLMSFEKT